MAGMASAGDAVLEAQLQYVQRQQNHQQERRGSSSMGIAYQQGLYSQQLMDMLGAQHQQMQQQVQQSQTPPTPPAFPAARTNSGANLTVSNAVKAEPTSCATGFASAAGGGGSGNFCPPQDVYGSLMPPLHRPQQSAQDPMQMHMQMQAAMADAAVAPTPQSNQAALQTLQGQSLHHLRLWECSLTSPLLPDARQSAFSTREFA